LSAVLARLDATRAEVIKAVFSAADALDALRLLEASREFAERRPTIALAMGSAGLVTRVLARKFGNWLTFAALSPERASATGQPTVAELRSAYGWDRIGPATRVFGVIGWPVEQSRSPQIHNAAMGATGIDGVYLPFAVRPDYESFQRFMDAVNAAEWLDADGFSVTIPHKKHALRWLHERGDQAEPFAAKCGAVNTLTRRAGNWRGHNTDGAGALAALAGCMGGDVSGLRGKAVLILGAGGAAHAIGTAMIEAGARVTVANRTDDRAEALARELGCAPLRWANRADDPADILINCTPVGMWPEVNETPLRFSSPSHDSVVFDTIYNPSETRLMREARASGRRVVGGREMFIAQAAEQFRIWHGRGDVARVMRETLVH
jgi:3-dehydroquinate dehydratase/shikimate dehydrogenase